METNHFGHNRLHTLLITAVVLLCMHAGTDLTQAATGNGFQFQEKRHSLTVFSFNSGSGPEYGLNIRKPLPAAAETLSLTDISFALSEESRQSARQDTVPHPRNVMFRSLVLPGWGQYTNRQAWKIPVVYALIGGVAYYAWFSDTRYRGFRAAFYNSNPENTDFRFGATPAWIDQNASADFLRDSRNFHRNRRDFLIIATVLSYGLNVLDAYVFAHMRDFDVSDDLSVRNIELGSSSFVAAQASAPVPLLSFNLRF